MNIAILNYTTAKVFIAPLPDNLIVAGEDEIYEYLNSKYEDENFNSNNCYYMVGNLSIEVKVE